MATAPHSIRRFAGLFGSSNPIARVPEGALLVGDNCYQRSPDILEPRRGYRASASCAAPINALAFKQGVAVGITYDNPGAGITGTLRKYDPAADAWTTLANVNPLPIDRPGGSMGVGTRFVSAQKALYFQSRYGLTKIEDIAANSCRSAIMSPPPGGGATLLHNVIIVAGIFSGNLWLASGSSVAYRFTIARFGANGELIESAPSDRIVVKNNGGSPGNVQFSVSSNQGSPGDSFLRVYRSVSSPATPSDELFLIMEVPWPNGVAQIDSNTSAGTIGPVSDLTSDSFLSVPLYTNQQTGGTSAVANVIAPVSGDIAWFRDRLYFLNTKQQQSLTVRIIGTGAGGISDGDSIVINGVSIVFSTTLAENGSYPLHATLSTAGSVSSNIESTSRDLTDAIQYAFDTRVNAGDKYAGSPLYSGLLASCLSGGAGTVTSGIILISSVTPGAAPFTLSTNSANGWDRNYTAGITSSPNEQVAGLSWSNPGEPEGVPFANNTSLGDPTAAGQRCIALKEALFVFKQDGLWKITDDGSDIGPLIQPVDPTIRLVAPETAVALDNFILALCDQGVVLISETGAVVNITHRQIERELFALMARVGTTTLANLAFGVAYPSEHTYILSLPESSNASACTRQYVYNLETQTWDSWTVPGVLCGAVHPDTGQLYFGRTDGTLWIERKSFDSSDYQDPGFTIASPSTSAVSSLIFAGDLRTGSTPFAVGDLIQQFQALHAIKQRVIAVTYSSAANQTTVKVDAVPRYAWSNAVPLTVTKAIQCKTVFLPFYADEPLQDKEWGDCYLSFRYCDVDFVVIGFTSEKYPVPLGTNPAQERINDADASIAVIPLQKWGVAPFGSTVWGRQAKDVILKCSLPSEVQGYSAQLTMALAIPCAYSRFELSAIDVKIAGETSQVSR